MRVLVTGGTGVVGRAIVTRLLGAEYIVRLYARHASQWAARWPDGVEACDGSIAERAQVEECAEGCDAVLHLAGITAEAPPDETFHRINVEGTRLIVREAERAGVRRFVYLSALGADRTGTPLLRSKREAETAVRAFRGSWTIVRTGRVYGPGDRLTTLLIKMVRTLPAVPVLTRHDEHFQPIWAEDLARALVTVLERDDLAGRTLEVAGEERVTLRELMNRIERLTNRSPRHVPLPGTVARLGSKLASVLGVQPPLSDMHFDMLDQCHVIPDDRANALRQLGVEPTPLNDGLRTLADATPEHELRGGVGPMHRKRFWADIVDTPHTPESLLTLFTERFAELTPWTMQLNVEPGSVVSFEEGATRTMNIPGRGHVQVRVQDRTPRSVVLSTLEGHPLVGVVRFLSEQRGSAIRFEAQIYSKASNIADRATILAGGDLVQDATWTRLVDRVVDASGGRAPNGIQTDVDVLNEDAEERIALWVDELIEERERETQREEITAIRREGR